MKDPKAKAHQQFSLAIEAARKANERVQELRRAMEGATILTAEFLEACQMSKQAHERMRRFGNFAFYGV